MDWRDDSSLMAYLRQVPDPRGSRGRSYEWEYLLAVVACALLAGRQGLRAMAEWARSCQAELVSQWQPRSGRVPSLSTLQRVLWALDVEALEAALAAYAQRLAGPASGGLRGVALDGKVPRGTLPFGTRVCLVAAAEHESGLVLGQVAVDAKHNELSGAQALVRGLDLRGRVVTADALHCQRALSQQVRAQGGHWLWAVKGNQSALAQALETLFSAPRTRDWPVLESSWTSRGPSHGRWEVRRFETSTRLNDWSDWPGLGQAIRRVCERWVKGQHSCQTTYFITSLSAEQADAETLEGLIRGHWSIENRVHYVRDVAFGEDACQQRQGRSTQVLAALRNALLNLLRSRGHTSITRALRHFAARPLDALAITGALRT